ncbi:MAG: rRNA maturation RNase YbeY [Coriobacteriia bacterium]|nr:rRNA maturation RNase YbeY [Coriobacteriia bacterium]
MFESFFAYTPDQFGLGSRQYEVLLSQSEPIDYQLQLDQLAYLALWAMDKIDVPEPAELSLSFVGSDEIRIYNRDYRGFDKSTDVLSFSADFDQDEPSAPDQPLALGDIVICPAIADRIDYGVEMTLYQKMEILVIHGILHLVGHDHEEQDQATLMESYEDSLLSSWRSYSLHKTGELPVVSEVLPEAETEAGTHGDFIKITTEQDMDGDAEEVLLTSAEMKGRSLLYSFKWAIQGIATTIKIERNMKIHLVVAAFAIVVSFLLGINPNQWAIIIICIALVLAAEMLNTALEHVVDLISPDYHPAAKIAKDAAAGVVLIFAICSVVAGLIIFGSTIQVRFFNP